MEVLDIDFKDVPQFSTRDKAFVTKNSSFGPFQKYASEFSSFSEVLKHRQSYPCDRDLLVEVLHEQYKAVKSSSLTSKNISVLSQADSYTVITAHQPSLMTGPLYYVFKILSAIKLAEKLNAEHSDKQIIPMFIIGSEDHDFEEINHFYLYRKKISWDETGAGPVGSYPISKLKAILAQTKEILGESNKAKHLLDTLEQELPQFKDYNDFAFRLTHLLFDHLGLVILRMNDPKLKRAFIPIIKREITERISEPLVVQTQQSVKEALNYDAQAFAREINLFYVKDRSRNRIEYKDDHYSVINTDLSFSEAEILQEVENYPERFSPNVILRPIFQEFILPNLAYIGGGGELAYWLERKSQFEKFEVSYPILIRRTSGMLLNKAAQKQLNKLGLGSTAIFKDEQILINQFIDNSDNPKYSLGEHKTKIEELFKAISSKVETIDQTLVKTTQSELTKALKSLGYLESKLKKSIKQKEEISLNRISKLKKDLFPKGLQERHDNIFQYLAIFGPELIDQLLEHCNPLDKKMKVFML